MAGRREPRTREPQFSAHRQPKQFDRDNKKQTWKILLKKK